MSRSLVENHSFNESLRVVTSLFRRNALTNARIGLQRLGVGPGVRLGALLVLFTISVSLKMLAGSFSTTCPKPMLLCLSDISGFAFTSLTFKKVPGRIEFNALGTRNTLFKPRWVKSTLKVTTAHFQILTI